MFKSLTSKRIIAYLIDIFIIGIVSSMFAGIDLLNPYKREIADSQNQYDKIIEEVMQSDNPTSILSDSELLTNYTYDMAKYGVYVTAIGLVITFGYFVLFQYYNKGRTIGKALMDIVVVNKNKKRVSFLSIFIRALIVNGICSDIVLLVSINTMNKNAFMKVNSISSLITFGVFIASIILLMFRDDKRLVHDLVAGTRVVFKDELDENVKRIKTKKTKVKKEK